MTEIHQQPETETQSIFDVDPEIAGRILIVDDSEQGTQILTLLLEDEGFEAFVANDGPTALEKINQLHPDVVILDVMMPGMSGMEVLTRIRNTPAIAELPVIMVTAMSETHDIVLGLELGANDYLPKPPQFEVLVARVRTQLKLKLLQDHRRETLAQLKQMDAVKDKFLSIAAHDLKNPLNNLGFGLALLKRYSEYVPESALEEYEKVIKLMSDSSETMRIIVTDFLDLQAMRAGQFTIEKEDMNLNEVVASVITQYEQNAETKEVALTYLPGDDLPNIQGDKNRLSQVISNLISNAIKFSPPGTKVEVRTSLTEGGVVFEVEDNGPGIPEDEMPLLFQEFARLSNKPTGGEKSSGVGLSIARRLIELHGGHIHARSEVGVGTTFFFELPVDAFVV